ncbi:YgiQ family radical SAM protein, partial [Thermodesulfobacteriota bacterium]
YLIASHPGCTVAAMQAMATTLKDLGLEVRQFQDFTPTPGTLSTAMYVSGLDRDTDQPIPVARNTNERLAQRKTLEAILVKQNQGQRRPSRPPRKAAGKTVAANRDQRPRKIGKETTRKKGKYKR